MSRHYGNPINQQNDFTRNQEDIPRIQLPSEPEGNVTHPPPQPRPPPPPPRPPTNENKYNDYTYSYKKNSTTMAEKLFFFLTIIVLIICPLYWFICYRVIKQYEKGVILRLGKIRPKSPVGPGLTWINPISDKLITLDVRTQPIGLQKQEIVTKDAVTVTVDAVVYYRVTGTIECIMNIQKHNDATEMLALAVLRNVCAYYTLADLLTSRESVTQLMREDLDRGTKIYGVDVERIELKDLILPLSLQKAMAAEAEGRRLAKAKVIAAQGEIKAAENLSIAAQTISQNPKIMQLRYLQTLNYIAADQSNTVLFPFPVDL